MNHSMRSADLPTGVTLQYVEQGDPEGVPVVLLHGASDSWRSYELVLPHLPGWIRAIAVSQRGHGDASRPRTGYRTRDFAADVAALLDALGIGQAVIVGHCMGGDVAQRFAIDYPDRARGLVLAATRSTWYDHPDIRSASHRRIRRRSSAGSAHRRWWCVAVVTHWRWTSRKGGPPPFRRRC